MGILLIIKTVENLKKLKDIKLDLSHNIIGNKLLWYIYDFAKHCNLNIEINLEYNFIE